MPSGDGTQLLASGGHMIRFFARFLYAGSIMAAADQNSWLVHLRQAKALELRGEYGASRQELLGLIESSRGTGLKGSALGVVYCNLGAVVAQMGDYVSA